MQKQILLIFISIKKHSKIICLLDDEGKHHLNRILCIFEQNLTVQNTKLELYAKLKVTSSKQLKEQV